MCHLHFFLSLPFVILSPFLTSLSYLYNTSRLSFLLSQVKTRRQREHLPPQWRWYQRRRCPSVSMRSLSLLSLWPRSGKSTTNWTAKLSPNRSDTPLLCRMKVTVLVLYFIKASVESETVHLWELCQKQSWSLTKEECAERSI